MNKRPQSPGTPFTPAFKRSVVILNNDENVSNSLSSWLVRLFFAGMLFSAATMFVDFHLDSRYRGAFCSTQIETVLSRYFQRNSNSWLNASASVSFSDSVNSTSWELTRKLMNDKFETIDSYIVHSRRQHNLFNVAVADPKHESVVSSGVMNVKAGGLATSRVDGEGSETARNVTYTIRLDNVELDLPAGRSGTIMSMNGPFSLTSDLTTLANLTVGPHLLNVEIRMGPSHMDKQEYVTRSTSAFYYLPSLPAESRPVRASASSPPAAASSRSSAVPASIPATSSPPTATTTAEAGVVGTRSGDYFVPETASASIGWKRSSTASRTSQTSSPATGNAQSDSSHVSSSSSSSATAISSDAQSAASPRDSSTPDRIDPQEAYTNGQPLEELRQQPPQQQQRPPLDIAVSVGRRDNNALPVTDEISIVFPSNSSPEILGSTSEIRGTISSKFVDNPTGFRVILIYDSKQFDVTELVQDKVTKPVKSGVLNLGRSQLKFSLPLEGLEPGPHSFRFHVVSQSALSPSSGQGLPIVVSSEEVTVSVRLP